MKRERVRRCVRYLLAGPNKPSNRVFVSITYFKLKQTHNTFTGVARVPMYHSLSSNDPSPRLPAFLMKGDIVLFYRLIEVFHYK